MNNIASQLLTTREGIDTLPIRIGAGVIFAAHGAQKLFGWFGGYGLEGTAGWLASIGLEPGYALAALAGSARYAERELPGGHIGVYVATRLTNSVSSIVDEWIGMDAK